MKFHVLTLFPEMIEAGLKNSVTGRAIKNGLMALNCVNIRGFSDNKHQHVDDYPYGGGAGMVMQPGPIHRAYLHVTRNMEKKPRVVYLTPQGRVFNQALAENLAEEDELIFLCGHYEGVDERILEEIVTDNVSIGDYVLTGGELPAMVMIDCIARLIPGVLNNEASAEFESFHDNLLEYPQYTRPEVYEGKPVPEVLLSGHHANIERWRREQSLKRTLERRPDLLKTASLDKNDIQFLKQSGYGLIENIDKLHTTKMGAERIKRNLQLETDDVVPWCRARILDKDTKIERIGKNWYATAGNCKITINAHSYTIITAHKIKKSDLKEPSSPQ